MNPRQNSATLKKNKITRKKYLVKIYRIVCALLRNEFVVTCCIRRRDIEPRKQFKGWKVSIALTTKNTCTYRG